MATKSTVADGSSGKTLQLRVIESGWVQHSCDKHPLDLEVGACIQKSAPVIVDGSPAHRAAIVHCYMRPMTHCTLWRGPLTRGAVNVCAVAIAHAVFSGTGSTFWFRLARTRKVAHTVAVVALWKAVCELDSGQKLATERYAVGNALVCDSRVGEV